MILEDTQVADHARHLRDAVEACTEARSTCLRTATYCIETGGRHLKPDHLRLLMDAAEVAGLHAGFLLRGSQYRDHTAAAAIAVLRAAAADCDGFEGDGHMLHCAEACRRAADSCEDPASDLGGAASYDDSVAQTFPASDPTSTRSTL